MHKSIRSRRTGLLTNLCIASAFCMFLSFVVCTYVMIAMRFASDCKVMAGNIDHISR